MALHLQSPFWLILVWILAGLITLCGALSIAEAAALFPETGGPYVFFQKMYGRGFSFLYGWASFSVFNTAGNASIAFVCAMYLQKFLPTVEISEELLHMGEFWIYGLGKISIFENLQIKLLTCFLLLLSSIINAYSVQKSSQLQIVLSTFKLVAIGVLILGALFVTDTHFSFQTSFSDRGDFKLAGFMIALTGAFWAYDGWTNLGFSAGEVINPQKNIPKALFWGICITILVYALLNIAFISVIGIQDMAKSSFIGADAAAAIWGDSAAIWMSILVVLAVFSAAHANVFSTARATMAFAVDCKPIGFAQQVHFNKQTPAKALFLNLCISCVLVISGSFDRLTDMLIFVSWFFYAMSAVGIIILRFRYSDIPRKYKVPFYPLTPILFAIFSLGYLVLSLINDIQMYLSGEVEFINSLFGILITAIGIPIYFFSSSKHPVKDEK